MAIFTKIDLEEKIQENDKTRLGATRSYISDGDAISSVKIKPSKNATEITITSGNKDLWFLDYEYLFTLDVDATNNKFDFNEGGSELTATITTAEYSLSTLATEIKTQLDATGALTYTVEVTSADEIKISATGTFVILGATGSNSSTSILGDIGFTKDSDSATEATGDEEISEVEKEVTVTVDNGTVTDVKTETIQVISERGDDLWSEDSMLKSHEPDVLRYITEGRNSYLDRHRLAQDQILGWMDKEGMVDLFRDKITKEHVTLPEEFEQWSKFVTLRLIYDSISNQNDDIFFAKARQFEKQEQFFRGRAVLRLDIDLSGTTDDFEEMDIRTVALFRR